MASIVKRKNKFCVVYTYYDENGKKRQKWETFDNKPDAEKRKIAVEFEMSNNTLVVSKAITVSELLEEYTTIYGVNSWAMSTYEARRSLMSNYITPILGDVKLSELNTRTIEKYYQHLLTVKSKVTNRKPNNEYLSSHVVREIHKLLRSAFNQAVKWELMSKNPCINATLPQEEHKPREIWDADTLFKALELCTDDLLKLAINLSFSCSLRIGEMLGLTWDCINIEESSVENGSSFLFVNKELQRVNRDSLEKLNEKDVIFKFPACFVRTNTILVLKAPKTKSSVRKVFIPKTVAKMLIKRKSEINEHKELFGDEYLDYNLVFCNEIGRPMEGQVITRALQKLIQDNNLPPVVFHSLRHSSITYKLKLNGGDVKSVQGDSGHAQVKMVTDVYSHILDDDRRLNAQRFEEAFYKKDEPKSIPEEQPRNDNKITDEQVLNYMLDNPEFIKKFKAVLGL